MNHNIQACALLVLVGAQGHGCSIAPNSPAPQECLLAFMQPSVGTAGRTALFLCEEQ